jgi:hypothetical protein
LRPLRGNGLKNRFGVACLSSAADNGFSPPLCFVEMPLTALPVGGPTPPGSDRFTSLLFA